MANWLECVVKARFLVGALGETASPPWWRTEATSAAGLSMLRHPYPRTYLTASLNTVSRAASAEHDARIGRLGAYHLFRLPTSDELAIHEWLGQAGASKCLASLAGLGRAERLTELAKLAERAAPPGGAEPVLCGRAGDLPNGRTLPTICAAYLAGFQSGRPVYPYLEEGE